MQLLRLSLWTKYYDVIIQKKPFKQYFHVVMALFLRVVPSLSANYPKNYFLLVKVVFGIFLVMKSLVVLGFLLLTQKQACLMYLLMCRAE